MPKTKSRKSSKAENNRHGEAVELGRRMKIALINAGISQYAAAKKLNVSNATMINYIGGDTVMDIITARDFCALTGISLDSLFGFKDERDAYESKFRDLQSRLEKLEKYRQRTP